MDRMETQPVKAAARRLPQFSLRTMFVVVTLIALWFGWTLRQVRERERLLELPGVHRLVLGGPPNPKTQHSPPLARHVPRTWSMFGADHALGLLLDRNQVSAADCARCRALFPEADIWQAYLANTKMANGNLVSLEFADPPVPK